MECNQEVLPDGKRLVRTGSVRNRKAILLYTTESIQITKILKSGLDAVVNSPFATDDDDCYNLERLDISNCPNLDKIAIFKAKENMQQLLHIAISGNRQFMILVITCLCSCPELVTIEAHGLEFSAEELLFVLKTFESARSGSLQIEKAEGYDALCIMNILESELF